MKSRSFHPLWLVLMLAALLPHRLPAQGLPQGFRTSVLHNNPTGAITWFSSNAPNGTPTRWIYRYGYRVEDALTPAGEHPSLALVPLLKANDPLASSSILYRGREADSFSVARPVSGTTQWYPGLVENTLQQRSVLLSALSGSHAIYSNYRLSPFCGETACLNDHDPGIGIKIGSG